MTLTNRAIKKINRKTKYAFTDLKNIFGLNEKLFRNARGAGIVCYHGICIKEHLKYNNIFLRLKTFKAHLLFYKKYFNIVSLDDYYAQRFSNDKFNVCISFDDGYSNNYKYVLPLLKEYRIPAIFFITAIREAGYDILWDNFLGIFAKDGPEKINYKNEIFYKDRYGKYISRINKRSLKEIIRSGGFRLKKEMMEALSPVTSFRGNKSEEDFWLLMTDQQIKELAVCEFCSFGAHGYYHNDLTRISLAEAREEMMRTKQYLETLTKRNVFALAFPYGTYSKELVEVARQTGYNKLLALDFNSAEDKTDITMRERLTINPYISIANQMTAIIKNRYE
ncbi:MAG: polysaccharide deacetylase family protein [Panacibacter sp.]